MAGFERSVELHPHADVAMGLVAALDTASGRTRLRWC
jgi:hypothetical protein